LNKGSKALSLLIVFYALPALATIIAFCVSGGSSKNLSKSS
jgi:hypothetical protein